MSEPVGTVAVDAIPEVVARPATDERKHGPGPVAIAVLVIGFGLAAAAQYLPWSTLDTKGITADPEGQDVPTLARRSLEITLIDLNTAHVTAYLGTVVLAIVAIAVLVVTRGTVRRVAAAAALGLLAGNALVLIGFQSALKAIGTNPYTAFSLPEDAVSVGPGYPLACAATATLAAGAIIVAGNLLQVHRRSAKNEHFDGPEPLELTVTPVAPR